MEFAFGVSLLVVDYRGYGWSEGTPAVDLIVDDATQILLAMKTRFDVDYDNLIVFGQSLGGAIAINAVARVSKQHKIKALIFDSTFSDFRKIAQEKLNGFWLTWAFQWPLSYAFTNEYSPLKAIKSIHDIPVLGIHGEQDQIIPISHGERLFKAANEPKEFWVVKKGHHIESMLRPDIRKRLLQYLEGLDKHK